MVQQYTHLQQSAEIAHNCQELLDYFQQIQTLFHQPEALSTAGFSAAAGHNTLIAIQELSEHIDNLQQYLISEHFPSLSAPRSYHLIHDRAQQSLSPKVVAKEAQRRVQNLQEQLTAFYPGLSTILSTQGLNPAPIGKRALLRQLWQDCSFDIDFLLSRAVPLDRAAINHNTHLRLVKFFKEPKIWTAHKAHQGMGKAFEHLHFIVSKMQSLVRLRTMMEPSYSADLGELVQLNTILRDFEIKVIKQKRAENKRLLELEAASCDKKSRQR